VVVRIVAQPVPFTYSPDLTRVRKLASASSITDITRSASSPCKRRCL